MSRVLIYIWNDLIDVIDLKINSISNFEIEFDLLKDIEMMSGASIYI